jgi:CPA2 family monovalent cation:H+ antiporter-2
MMALKLITGSLATLALGLPLRVALLVGFSLNQIGEFSFILAKTGLDMQLISQADYQFLLAVTVPGMALTPLMMRLGEVVSHRIPAGRHVTGKDEPGPAEAELSDHLIVVGFGLGGRNVARACRAAGITYRVLEMNPRTVRQEKAAGEPIMYGDAVSQAVLEHVGVAKARAMVLTIPDPVATRQVTSLVKTLHPSLHLIVRTRYLKEMQTLYKLGADEVVPEEYETAVEIFARVLRRFLVPGEEIARQVAELRAQDYEMLRELSPDRGGVQDLSSYLPGVDIVTWRLAPDSPLNGISLGQTELRGKWGVTMLALNRQGNVISNPGADTILQAGDVAVLMGPPQRLRELACQFDKKPDCQTES